jgi:hypothetical protein
MNFMVPSKSAGRSHVGAGRGRGNHRLGKERWCQPGQGIATRRPVAQQASQDTGGDAHALPERRVEAADRVEDLPNANLKKIVLQMSILARRPGAGCAPVIDIVTA